MKLTHRSRPDPVEARLVGDPEFPTLEILEAGAWKAIAPTELCDWQLRAASAAERYELARAGMAAAMNHD